MQVNVGNTDESNDCPKTIDELKLWYFNNNLPPAETTRFFIGVNYLEPKAFGIYKEEETGNFIVYKNKDDGSRATRYKGPDEAHAVKELYDRLKQEVLAQKNNDEDDDDDEEEEEEKTTKKTSKSSNSSNEEKSNSGEYKSTLDEPKKSNIGGLIIIGAIIALIVFLFTGLTGKPKKGYYNFENNYYYYQSNVWYKYETSWVKLDAKPEALDKDNKTYFINSEYNSSFGIQRFEDSIYYVAPKEENEVNNTNTNWTSNESWNSNSTNTSSDW